MSTARPVAALRSSAAARTTSSSATGATSVAATPASLPGEVEQVLDGPLRRDHLVEHAPLGRTAIAAGVGQVDLQLGPHPGERVAQLVGCIGDEAALPFRRTFDPLEHRVHRACQAGDLVVSRRLVHPAVQVGAAHGGDLGAHRLDGAQGPAGEPPQHDGEHRSGRGYGQQERAPECGRRIPRRRRATRRGAPCRRRSPPTAPGRRRRRGAARRRNRPAALLRVATDRSLRRRRGCRWRAPRCRPRRRPGARRRRHRRRPRRGVGRPTRRR